MAADAVEVGSGPGVLLGLLVDRNGICHLSGIDPSPEIRLTTVRSLTRAVADARVRIRPGDAGCTGLPDAVADVVVSVNSVAIWPDLDAGVEELGRILRPDGDLVLSWHGGSSPSRSRAAMSLTADQLDRVDRALSARFDDVRRELTRQCTVFVARCPQGSPRSSRRPGGSPRGA